MRTCQQREAEEAEEAEDMPKVCAREYRRRRTETARQQPLQRQSARY